MRQVWECKIGGDLSENDLPPGADSPMRMAIEDAYFRLTGKHAEFNFSGWGAKLDPGEESIVDHKPWPRILPKFREIRTALGGSGYREIVALDEGGGAWRWTTEGWEALDKLVPNER